MTGDLEILSVREVTDDEVAFYEEHGWVRLPGLIDRTLAKRMLEVLEELYDSTSSLFRHPDDQAVTERKWRVSGGDLRGLAESVTLESGWFWAYGIDVEPVATFARSWELGRALHRLMNRQRLTDQSIGVRFGGNALTRVAPHETRRQHRYHQDTPFGTDRVGALQLWVALDETSPEQAPPRFLSGSHREGPLGSYYELAVEGRTVIDHYPKLLDLYNWSLPFHYEPGDATVHHCYTIHSTPENRSDRARFNYIGNYRPTDSLPMPSGHSIAGDDTTLPVIYP